MEGEMLLKGRVWKFGMIYTDAIHTARYLNTSDPKELQNIYGGCDKEFPGKVRTGIFFCRQEFRLWSSREHAPIAIKAAGIQAVIAKSFARIFIAMPLI